MDSITQLLRRYQRHPNQTLAAEIFPALAQSQVYVPVNLNKNGDLPAESDNAFGLKPDTIPGPGGKVLFPAFTAQTQIANEYGQRFSFLHLPFVNFCSAALSDPNFGGIVLDPFTSKFLMPEEVVRTFQASATGLQ